MTVIVTCAMSGSYDVATNVRRHLELIDEAVGHGADLVVFPECSLHGYPDRSMRTSSAGRRLVAEMAESVTDGPASRAVIDHAVSRAVHVVYGMNESIGIPGKIFNTAVITGPDGLIGRYRKVHLGHAETGTWEPGDSWPVFKTPFAQVGLLICGDKAWPESTRELALGGAELLIMPTAWAFTVGGDDTVDACWGEYYLMFDRVRAAENSRWFVSSNFVGPLGDSTFGGYSQIVDPTGSVLVSSETRPGLVVAEVDVGGAIAATEAAWLGPGLVRDRRPGTYRRIAESGRVET